MKSSAVTALESVINTSSATFIPSATNLVTRRNGAQATFSASLKPSINSSGDTHFMLM